MLDRNTLRNLVEQANQISDVNLNEDVAETILQQLGGKRFIVMTGAKNLLKSNGGKTLSFKLPKAISGINYVEITLDSSDTYTMKFISLRANQAKTIKNLSMIYADQLQSVFTANTGLHTKL